MLELHAPRHGLREVGDVVVVTWEVSPDPGFGHITASGSVSTDAGRDHTVKFDATGLAPDSWYHYRFHALGQTSTVGRTRTAPRRDEMPATLAMSAASCANWEAGFFTAYRYLADDEPDLVLHLGDYQYEGKGTTNPAAPRVHAGSETVTLEGYRLRHAQYKTDPDLQTAHAIAPWLVVWDDHEVENNYADEIADRAVEQPGFVQRRAAAYQAYYENMPLRRSSIPRGSDMQIYRRLGWGRLASFHMLDTRQYRDDQVCEDGWDTNCEAALDPSRTITGAAQEQWLREGFSRSGARWDFLGQQVFFTQRDGKVEQDLLHTSNDAWDGYVGSRDRVTRAWMDAGVRNPVVLTGDVHKHWAADVKTDYADPDSPVVGTELVASSITSGGNGNAAWSDPIMEWNPHLRFSGDLRGYLRTTVTPTGLRADFRSVDRVTTRGGAVATQASFEVADGQRGLRPVG